MTGYVGVPVRDTLYLVFLQSSSTRIRLPSHLWWHPKPPNLFESDLEQCVRAVAVYLV